MKLEEALAIWRRCYARPENADRDCKSCPLDKDAIKVEWDGCVYAICSCFHYIQGALDE